MIESAPRTKVTKEGYIVKKGWKVKNWKKRYLVIETDKLSYYEDETKEKKRGEIMHKYIKDVQPLEEYGKGKKKPYIFALVTLSEKLDRTYLIQIGRGGFGRVLLVKKKDSGQIYAMKVLKKRFIVAQNQVTHTTTERNVMVKLEHPFLTKLHFAFQDEKNLYFVMDFINGGELFHHLRREKKFSEERTKFYAAEIISAITYLHTRGIVYRDLKPENVLLGREGHVVVTDFGLAKEGLHGEQRTETRAGTPEYLAPEVIKGEKYTKSVDWWAVGILVYEMLTGAPPFYDNDIQKLFHKITAGDLLVPDNLTSDAGDFLAKLLTRDPTKRLSDPAKIKAHPWFKSLDFEKLEAKEIQPPFIPKVAGADDLAEIDPEFLKQSVQDEEEGAGAPSSPAGVDARKVTLNDLFVGFTFIEQ